MMKKWIALFVTVLGTGLSAAEVVIAEKGQAKAEIVIPAQPNAIVKFAADELKQYLDKMTGGSFPIVSRPTGAVAIRLGQSPEAGAAGLKPETLKRGGFFISAKGNDIFIVGVDGPALGKSGTNLLQHLYTDEPSRGTLHGVYEFLEQLGVRWPAPGPEHEFVPACTTLKVPEGLRKVEPFFQERSVYGLFNWQFPGAFPDAKAYCPGDNDILLWALRQRLHGRSVLEGCHTERCMRFEDLWGKESGNAALIHGKRDPRYSCWTSPDVAAFWEKAADIHFSGQKPWEAGLPHLKPDGKLKNVFYVPWYLVFVYKDQFMIDPMDFYAGCDGRCRCPRCEEFRAKFPCEDDSEILWRVIAGVAESMKKKHPGKFVTTTVYPWKERFPKYVKLPDNLRVKMVVEGGPSKILKPDGLQADLDLLRTFKDTLGGDKIPLWINLNQKAVPATFPHLIAKYLTISRDDISGLYYGSQAPTHTQRNLDVYIAARLLWNPNRDVETELADYFRSYYGPAAEPAQRLFKRFEDNWIAINQGWIALGISPDYNVVENSGTPDKVQEMRKQVEQRRQQFLWSKVYTPEEMSWIAATIAAIETAAAPDPVFAKRAGLLRQLIFNPMKGERAEVMDKEETRRKTIVKAPVVTAEPTQADWATAPVYQMISAARLKPQLAAAGQFQLLRVGDTLRLRAELKEPNLADSLTKKDRKPGDANVWQDNDVEIFIYACNTKDLWQIIVNDQGCWASQKINTGVSTWMQLEKFQVKVQPSADGWLLEATIPLEQFGAGELRFNLARNRQIKGQPNELSTWSPLAKVGGWHDPNNYGTLDFGGK